MKSKACCSFVVFCLCLTLFIDLTAQEKITSRHYTMKDGLPDEGVVSIIQDSEGFIWLGTYSGLCKFDGYRITNYKHSPTFANSLTSNVIVSLWEDGQERLWIGHGEGLDIFDPVKEKFYYPWPDSLNLKNKFGNGVGKFYERDDGKLLICTANGLFQADTQTLLIERISALPRETFFDVAETKDGSIWVTSPNRLYQVDSRSGQTTAVSCRSSSVEVDKNNRLWVGINSSLSLFNADDRSFTPYIKNINVTEILQKPNGKLMIGSSQGLFELDPGTGEYEMLTEGYVTSVMNDKQGITWVGSFDGLKQLNPKIKKFNNYSQFKDIGPLMADSEQQIWMVASVDTKPNEPVLFRFDPALKLFNRVQRNGSKKNNFSSDFVTSIFQDNEGTVLLITTNGVEKFDSKRQTTTRIADLYEAIAFHIDSLGTVWVGRWDWISGRCVDDKQAIKIPSGTVYCFLEDHDHNLWIGTGTSLIQYNLKTEKWKVLKNDPNDRQSISGNSVFHITMDSHGTIWFGTDGGINQLINLGSETDAPKFKHWSTEESALPNNNVYSIVDGKDGTLWLACGNMISHFHPQEGIFRNYDYGDGLSGKNFRGAMYLPGKGVLGHNGEIYFGSASGLVVFHPDSLQNNSYIPPVKVTGLSINNHAVSVKGSSADTGEMDTPLHEVISYANQMELSYNQNDFTFEFAALSFVDSENNQYKYKLEPFETEWIETTSQNRIARYTNISPGEYTFRVIASNNDGVWNEQGTSLTIIITPPWWKTWWAYTLYSLAFVGVLLYWRSYENKRVILKHRAEHLSELDDLKTRFFTNITHEFRTPITLIQGPLKEMYEKSTNKNDRAGLALTLRNAQRLSRLINQLLDLSKLEAGKMVLHAVEVDMVQFLREVFSSYESLAVSKGIKYFFNPEVSELNVYVDKEKMEKVVHNLLANAFKFTKENGEIVLNLRSQGKKCLIIVRDTGIGITADQVNKIFDRFYQVDSSQTRGYEGTGLGMALSKELVELHHGTITVESTEGNGTMFTVTLPLGKDHLKAHEIVEDERRNPDPSIAETFMSPEHSDVKTADSTEQPILLIVEDNVDMRQYIRRIFSDQYQILEAANGREGLDKSKEVIPDLIVSDVMMPEMDGYKFCEQIKTDERTSHIPVILLTAKADHESKLQGLETGADDYLSKPFDADELKLIVKNRIDQRKKMQERFSREVTIGPKQISITSMDENFLTKVLAIIEEHMDDEMFSIDELSREAGFSNMHFYRKIKALTNNTPSQFLRTIRLKRAAELLTKKSDNVSQIAYSVGFSSLSYFSKCFKEQFGVTPGQFSEKNASTNKIQS